MLELDVGGVGWVKVADNLGTGLRAFGGVALPLLLKANGGGGLLNNWFVPFSVCAYWLSSDFKVLRVSHLEAHYGLGVGRGVWCLELPVCLFRAGLFKKGDVLSVKGARGGMIR